MKFSIRFSKFAVRDLDRVFSEVYEISPDAGLSEKYINDLLEKVESKADFPESGIPLFYENSFTGYYYLIFKSYLVFYHLDRETIFIDRVLFGKSDYIRKLHLF